MGLRKVFLVPLISPSPNHPVSERFTTIKEVFVWAGPSGFGGNEIFQLNAEDLLDVLAEGEAHVFRLAPPGPIPKQEEHAYHFLRHNLREEAVTCY